MIIYSIIIFCIFFYVARVVLIMAFSKRCRNSIQNKGLTEEKMVSVVVPAMNEQENIGQCLTSILQSNYNNFEIIVVNDRSTDNTLKIIQDIALTNEKIKIVNIQEKSKNPNLQGKPGAVDAGVRQAMGDIILFTDADCAVKRNWIRTIVSQFQYDKGDKPVGMVCAYTNLHTKNLFHKFQAVEWIYMHTYACAGIGMRTILGCFGNNIAITKEAYWKVGGYSNIKFSVTEDFALLKSVFDAKYAIRYLCDTDSAVTTFPVNTFAEYMSQRRRWARGGRKLGWKAYVYVASSVSLWLAIILSACYQNWYLLGISITVRFLGDAGILFPILDILKIKHLKKVILLSVCYYSFVEFALAASLPFKKITWKGQTFKE